MKKALIIALFMIMLIGSSYAESCPLPCKPNTNAVIKFQGFEWYTDFKETIKAATDRGLKYEDSWIYNHFDLDESNADHWKVMLNSVWTGGEKGCGGYVKFSNYGGDRIKNVGGYRVDDLRLYMMYNHNKGATLFKSDDAVWFYMAKYKFDVTDKQACYLDLVRKLKELYGNNPYDSGDGWGTKYTCWVNYDNAMVMVSCDDFYVQLLYMAPGAEEMLTKLELDIAQKEIENAGNDKSGL